MWKIAFVGHSQIPISFEFPNTEIRIFRAPGGKASNYFQDSRMNQILQWEHDLTILWIGSNDINGDANPVEIYNDIKEIYQEIETNCQSVVYICQVEPRTQARDIPADIYKRIQYGINNRIKRSLKTPNIHFNNVSFVEELSDDGVHWSGTGRVRVESKFKKVIKEFIGKTRMMSEE